MRIFWLNGALMIKPTTDEERKAINVLYDNLRSGTTLTGSEAYRAEMGEDSETTPVLSNMDVSGVSAIDLTD